MAALARTEPVYQAGTLSGNPLATAAGCAVLDHVCAADYEELSSRAARFARDLGASITAGGLGAGVASVGPLVGLFVAPPGITIDLPTDYDGCPGHRRPRCVPEVLPRHAGRGIALAPGPYEALFPGLAHTELELALAVEVAGEAAAEVAAAMERT